MDLAIKKNKKPRFIKIFLINFAIMHFYCLLFKYIIENPIGAGAFMVLASIAHLLYIISKGNSNIFTAKKLRDNQLRNEQKAYLHFSLLSFIIALGACLLLY